MKRFALFALTALTACTSGGNQMTAQRSARVLSLGDSYTIGEAVEPSARWSVQMVTALRAEGVDVADPEIIARTGWTTDELSKAIDDANPQGPYDLVTLLIGVNNQYRGRDLENYRSEYRALLDRAIGFAAGDASRVIVVSIPDWGVTPFAKGRDAAKIAREIDAYNAVKKEETSRAGAHFVDITPGSRNAASDLSLLASDGLHPSASMYAEWSRAALPAARKILKR